MKVMVIQTGMKVQSLVVSNIMPSFESKPVLKVYFIKSRKEISPPWKLIKWSKFSTNFNKPTGFRNILIFIQTNLEIWKKMREKVFDFSNNCDLEWKAKPRSSKLNWCKNVKFICPYHQWSIISRVPDQNGISQACYIVMIYHSGQEPSISSFKDIS